MNEELIRKTVQKEIINGIKKELDSALIFTYIQSLEQENKELHNKIDKVIELIECSKEHILEHDGSKIYLTRYCIDELEEILKGDVDESARNN